MSVSSQTRKQKGGSEKLYYGVEQITPEEIETLFCSGRSLEEMPVSEAPLFILKWGPPGSGKSSEKVKSQVSKLGLVEKDSIDFTPDRIIEALLPFRYETAAAKLSDVRIGANLQLKNFAHAKQLLQKYALASGQGHTRKTQAIVKDFIDGWTGRGVSEPQSILLNKLRKNILYDKITSSYKHWRGVAKNTDEKTVRDKMDEFLSRAMGRGVSMQYETMGSGYGEETTAIQIKNEFTGARFTRGRVTKSVIDIFTNTWEAMLGKIIYNKDGAPISIEKGGAMYIPDTYSVIVVYPILPRDEIIKRATTRAIRQLSEKNDRAIVGPLEEYTVFLETYAAELSQIISSGQRSDALKKIIGEAIEAESRQYLGAGTNATTFVKYIEGLADVGDEAATISFPYYRAIAPQRIMDVAEQAFQYSVDYFLKQYILLGRIKSVVYISNI